MRGATSAWLLHGKPIRRLSQDLGQELNCRVPARCGAWPGIEAVSDGIEFLPGTHGLVGAHRLALAHQAAGVLAGSTLSGSAVIAKIHARSGGGGELGMMGHLTAQVVGHGLAQQRKQGLPFCGKNGQRRGRSGIRHLGQQHELAYALEQHSDHRWVSRALDEVPFQRSGMKRSPTSCGRT